MSPKDAAEELVTEGVVTGAEWLAECDSTNTRLLAKASTFTGRHLLGTDAQTAGRGRRSADWWTGPGDLAFSLLLDHPGENIGVMSLAVGLGVAEAAGNEALVKWPNDVLVGGCKLAGVLIETTPARVVVGIGMNVNADTEVPAALRASTTSLSQESGRPVNRGETLKRVVRRVLQRWDTAADAPSGLLAALRQRDALCGRRVEAGGNVGIAAGIDAAGRLQLEGESGRVVISSGSVRLLEEP